MRAALAVAVATLVLTPKFVAAATTQLTDTWQNIGNGPVLLQAVNGSVMMEASAQVPTDQGIGFSPTAAPFAYNTVLPIWARRRGQAYLGGSSVPTFIVTTPVTIGNQSQVITSPLGANLKSTSLSVAPATDFLGQATMAGSLPVTIASNQSAVPVTVTGSINSGTCSTTQTLATGTSGVLVAANALRKSLRWMNVGGSDVTVAPGTTPPSVGQGMIYAATALGRQGGSETYNDATVAANAFAFAAAASATVVVWECQ